MKGYIQVTDRDKGFHIILQTSLIKSVVEDKNGQAVIEMLENRSNWQDIIYCAESFETVSALLLTA